MKILVTGGTGVVGTGTVTELLSRGHEVVLLSRHARADARQWTEGVTAINGNVANAESIARAADGCDAVLHLAGIVEETGPDATFEKVNVAGTANLIAEAQRAGFPRFIFASSLGADRGSSAYHQSKQRAEALVRSYRGSWTIARPGNVYGPGDEQISVLLRMVRGASPVIPTIGDGDQQFQPIWWEDCARALALMVERTDLSGRELDFTGTERTSQNDLVERLNAITGREVHHVAVPEFLATLGARMISLVGWDVGLTDDQLQMLRDGNVIPADGVNALTEVLGVTPTSLDTGLRALCDLQPEQLPDSGIGSLKRKRFWADIAGSSRTAEEVFTIFRSHFNDVTPVFVEVGAEPGESDEVVEGATLTLALPMRGHVQVRVTSLEERRATLQTLAGHPLAGAVRFLSEERGQAVRFQVEVYDRAANVIDLIAMRTLGDRLQDQTWTNVVERMVELSGGAAADGIQYDSESLDDDEAELINDWLESLVVDRKREENDERIGAA